MAFEFLKPVSDAAQAHALLQPRNSIGNVLKIHTEHAGVPQLDGVQMALIGILENRRDENALQQIKSLDHIRNQFYELYPGNWVLNIVDLGDIEAGATVDDTYFVLRQLTEKLLTQKIIPIFLGGSQDLMYPIYRAFDDIQHMINVVNVDCRFDLGDIEAPISSRSYVGKMVTEQPYNLFNYSNLGYQTYFNSQDEIELLERMYFDAIRLGLLDDDIKRAEPVMRDADIVGVDMAVVKFSDYAFAKANPNGLNGQQICTLSRYAGISDRAKVFGIFEIPKDMSVTGSKLVAEMIWYFIEGVNYRAGEHPVNVKNGFLKYKVPIDDDVLIFYKSSNSGRWWIELPFISNVNNKLKQHTLLPCTRLDYEQACNQNIPERWLKARRKNEV